jgi:hypothetical protein
MGFGGINCHIALRSAAPPSPKLAPRLPVAALLASVQRSELFVLSAPSVPRLAALLAALLPAVEGMAVCEMPDLALHLQQQAASVLGGGDGEGMTLATRHHPARSAVVAGSPASLLAALEALLAATLQAEPSAAELVELNVELSGECPAAAGPAARWFLRVDSSSGDREEALAPTRVAGVVLGFAFPGQGSQALNVARVLTQRFAWARQLAAQADAWVQDVGCAPVSALLFVPTDTLLPEQLAEAEAALSVTDAAQPAICLACLLWLRYLREEVGLVADYVAGHSLGELLALHAAGALSSKQVMQLAALRGAAMAKVSGSRSGAGSKAVRVSPGSGHATNLSTGRDAACTSVLPASMCVPRCVCPRYTPAAAADEQQLVTCTSCRHSMALSVAPVCRHSRGPWLCCSAMPQPRTRPLLPLGQDRLWSSPTGTAPARRCCQAAGRASWPWWTSSARCPVVPKVWHSAWADPRRTLNPAMPDVHLAASGRANRMYVFRGCGLRCMHASKQLLAHGAMDKPCRQGRRQHFYFQPPWNVRS